VRQNTITAELVAEAAHFMVARKQRGTGRGQVYLSRAQHPRDPLSPTRPHLYSPTVYSKFESSVNLLMKAESS
jgi:hypothetical protein